MTEVYGPRKPRFLWPALHVEHLQRHVAAARLTYSEITAQMNEDLGTKYTRHAILGKAFRLGHCKPVPRVQSEARVASAKARNLLVAQLRRMKRWAEKPSLKEKYERAERLKANRGTMTRNGASKTSAEYRRHIPRMREMTKSEMRAMLTAAVQNTAAMP